MLRKLLIERNVVIIAANTKWFFAVVIWSTILFLGFFFNSTSVYADCSLSLATDNTISITLQPGQANIATNTLTVETDCMDGYNVLISGPTDTNLYLNGDSSNVGNRFYPSSGTKNTPSSIINNTNTWGYSLAPETTIESSTFIGLTGTTTEIVNKETATQEGGDEITVYYGASSTELTNTPGSYRMADSGTIRYVVLANAGIHSIYEVSFDPSGGTIPGGQEWEGSGDSASKIATDIYGALPEPTKANYAFTGWSILPNDYQAVDYVEAKGTQYILTDVVPSPYIKVVADIYQTSSYTGESAFLGARDASTDQGHEYYYDNLIAKLWVRSMGQSGTLSSSQATSGQKTHYESTIDSSGTYLTVNAETVSSQISIAEQSNTTKYALFAYNRRGEIDYLFRGRIYYLKIYDNDVLVANYIPCYRKSDGVIGMFDTVRSKFYTNNGTGTFSKGSNISSTVSSSTPLKVDADHTLYATWAETYTLSFDANGGEVTPSTKTIINSSTYGELPTPTRNGYTFMGWSKNPYYIPSSYQEVEYTQSSGTQYIKTSIYPTQNFKVDAKVYMSSSYTSESAFLGVREGSPGKAIEYYFSGSGKPGFYLDTVASSKSIASSSTLYNQVVAYEATASSTGMALNVGGTLYTHSLSYGSSSFSKPLYIFAYNGNGSANYLFRGRIYNLKMYNNDSLFHEFIPCKRNSDGLFGLYDTIDNQFYSNNGSGSFSGGSVINSMITPTTQVTTNRNHTIYALWSKD